MKFRMPTDFYRELSELRACFGDNEYARDDIRPAALDLFRKYPVERERLEENKIDSILDAVERAEDEALARQGEMFDHEAHVALGGGCRIKRKRMNSDQLDKRERLIDANLVATQDAWKEEKSWIRDRREALRGTPPSTVVEDVINADGSPVALMPEAAE